MKDGEKRKAKINWNGKNENQILQSTPSMYMNINQILPGTTHLYMYIPGMCYYHLRNAR